MTIRTDACKTQSEEFSERKYDVEGDVIRTVKHEWWFSYFSRYYRIGCYCGNYCRYCDSGFDRCICSQESGGRRIRLFLTQKEI